ncbi:hypothetical protein V9U04_003882 [Salmonella enterica subsp. enterica]
MNIRVENRIIPSMDVSVFLPPDMLHKLALFLQKESHKKDHQIRLLKEAMLLARQQRFGRQAESFSNLQRALFEGGWRGYRINRNTACMPVVRAGRKANEPRP